MKKNTEYEIALNESAREAYRTAENRCESPKFDKEDLLEVLTTLREITVGQFLLIQARFNFPYATFEELGQTLGVSRQEVDKRIKRITKRSTIWEEVLRGSVRRGNKTDE